MGKKLLAVNFYILPIFVCLLSVQSFGQEGCTDQAPTVSVSTNSESTICDDETISFTGTVSPSDPDIDYVYQWQVSVNSGAWTNITGATNKDLSNYDAAIGSNRFRLEATYCNGDTEEDTVESPASGIITVYEKKEGSVTIEADKTAVCPGEEAVFSINSILNHGGSNAQYEWLLDRNPFPSPETGSTLTYAPSANDEISLRVNSGTPCVDDFYSTNTITLDIKPGTPEQPSAITTPGLVCPGEEENYSVSAVANATEYIWTLPNGSTQTTTQPNIDLTLDSAGEHSLSVQASNECGPSTESSTTITVNDGIPVQPGSISTPEIICPGEEYNYSISSVDGADEYLWTINGATQTTSDPSIDIIFNSTGDQNVSVQAVNECGTSLMEDLLITVNPDAPETPTSIDGLTEVCPGDEIIYSVNSDNTVTVYEWNAPTGWNIIATNENEITVVAGDYNQSGNISVTAKNDCGENAAQTLAVSVKPGIPDEPVISGEINVCTDAEETYSIDAIDFAEEYIWKFPSGWNVNNSGSNTVSVGGGTTSVTVIPGTSGGTVSVIASNSCGDSTEGTATLNIEDPAPDQPGEITYPNAENGNNVCQGTTETYSIAPVPRATSYLWNLPDGSTQTTTEPEISYTATTSGTLNLSVQGVNTCGSGPSRDFQIEVTDGVPGDLDEITSNLSNDAICPPTTNDITFSITSVDAADYYEWELPPGWEITNSPEGNSINVKVHASANYGNNESIRVRGWNICGPGNWSTLSGIAVDEYVITNAGPDQRLCSIQDPISIEGTYSFAGSNRNLKPTWTTTGTGQFNNNGSLTTTYTPSEADLNSGEVTLTLTTEAPNGACGPGEDEMTIYFRNDPTAQITSEENVICNGTSTEFTISGTPNTTVSYTLGGEDKTAELGAGDGTIASATLSTGELTETTNIALTSTVYTANDPGCSTALNEAIEIEVTPIPSASISYSGPYCTSMEETTGPADLQGENAYTGGEFTASGDLGSEIDPENGSFIPELVDPGTYTVTYTIPASGGCEEVEVTTEVTVTALPTAEISYPDAPFCSSDNTNYSVSRSGTGAYEGGSYSAPEGLNLDSSTGAINPSQSTPGDYTVTYTTPAGDGCEEVTVTTGITITEIPAPEISYTSTELCTSDVSTYEATITGSGAVEGGIFSASEGLSISSDGIITPESSTAGTYTVTYTLDTDGDGCDTVTATTEVTITEQPAVEINYNDGPFCESDSEKASVSFSNTAGVFDNGSFSSETGLAINETTGEITPNQSEPGSYTVTYTISSSGGCNEVIATTTVDITEVPSVVISYDETSFCNNDGTFYQVNFTEPVGNYENGSFAGTPGLEIDSETGAITPSASTTGVHTITYTIPTAEGCDAITTTTEITINEEILINSQPFSLGICSGESAQFEVSATGDNLTYQWYRSDGSEITGATSAILEISAVTSNDDGIYYVEVSGAEACSSVISEEVNLTVDENIVVETQPGDYDRCIGGEVTFSIFATANEGDVVYQWLFNGEEIEGQTGETLTLTDLTAEDAGEYSVFIEGPDGYSCSTITSGTGTLTLSEPPVADAGEVIITCYTSEAINISENATAENYSSVIWTHNGTGAIANAETLDEATYIPGEGESGTVTLTLTAYGNSTCAETSSEKNLEIEPIPVISSFSYSATEYCETDAELKTPTLTGEHAFEGGIFTVTPATDDLSIDEDGIIDPSNSTPGTYEIVYSTPEDAICDPVLSDPVTIVIGENPIADFEYDTTVYCKDTRDATQNTNPVLSVTEGHSGAQTFTTNGTGLELDPDTGAIDLSASDAGEYLITRTIDYTGEGEDGCTEVSASFEITINNKPIPDFTYEAQEFCSDPDNPQNISPTPIENAVLGAFTYTATPQDVTLSINTETGEIDITNSDEGEFIITNTVDYVDAEEDSCDPVSHDFTVTINNKSDAEFAYTKDAYCITDELATVVTEGFESGGVFSSETLSSTYLDSQTGIITWDSANEEIPGTHTIKYFIEGEGACEPVEHSTTIQIDPIPEGGELNFEGFDRLFTICENPDPNYAVPLLLSEKVGAVVAWKYRGSSDPTWSTVMEDGENYTGTSLSADQIEDIAINETTVFRVEINGGACSTNVFSETAIISVIPYDIKPTPVEVEPDVVCIGDEVTLTSGTGYESSSEFTGGAFDNSSITQHGWIITDRHGNTNYNFNSSADNTRPEKWLRTNPHDFETADITTHSLSNQRWDSGAEGNKGFAIVSGDNPSTLETPVFSLGAMDQAILSFDIAYNLTEGANIKVELSTNGGTSYDTIPLFEKSGPLSSDNYDRFGISNDPRNQISIDLGNYLGHGDLRIRFNYSGSRVGDIVTLDNIDLPSPDRNVSMEWNDYTDPENPVYIGDSSTEVWEPKQIGWNNFEVKTRLIFNSKGDACEVAENAETIAVYVFDSYTSSASAQAPGCGGYNVQLAGQIEGFKQGIIEEFPEDDESIALWEVIASPDGYEYSESHFINENEELGAVNDPQATFNPEMPGNYTLRWSINPDERSLCEATFNDISFELLDCTKLDFDGTDDYVDLGEGYTGDYSIEAWIRPETATGTIISTPNLEIIMEDLPVGVSANNRWYHIAVDSNGKLYVDGIDANKNISTTGSERAFIGARWEAPNTANHFSGWIEEVRIWNGNISQENIQFTMNQRLKADGNIGVEVDIDHPDAPDFGNLAGYYQLIATNILNGGYTEDLSGNSVNGKLRNMETLQENTAPLPYFSANDGLWATDGTWARPDVWDPPNSNGINGDPIGWNIVRTNHNINSGAKDITVLGLKSETQDKLLKIAAPGTEDENNDGQMLRVTHYLLLNGNIDLVGESQLLQDLGSLLAEESSGWLERDQQGTRNSYNYNYWTSPVSPQGSANNSGYTIGGILKDGTNSQTPKNINFQAPWAAADGERTDPIIISTYWLHGFNGRADVYGDWDHVGSTEKLETGEGFSMKGTSGSASIDMLQNYVFSGKPNNGAFSLPINMDMNYLIGNPYPSALDADEFILDNLRDVTNGRNSQNVFNGALYFWDHFGAENTHILREYVGGYAAYSLAGGVPAVSNDERINDNDAKGTKTPQRYIPVSQGFFVNTGLDENISNNLTVHGGDIVFQNSQREYAREHSDPSIFLKPIYPEKGKEKQNSVLKDSRYKIRLNFRSPTGYHRQLLVTADANTSNEFDLGYDAPLIDNNKEDFFWLLNKQELVIQAVPNFDLDQILSLGMKIAEEGEFSLEIAKLENMPESSEIYIRDNTDSTYYDLKEKFTANILPGYHDDRYDIVFYNGSRKKDDNKPGNGPVEISYSRDEREIAILNPELLRIEKVSIYSLLGQEVEVFEDVASEKEVRLQVERKFGTAVYIVKVITSKGSYNKKIIMK